MNFDQRFHAEPRCLGHHEARCLVVEHGQHHQNGIGPGDPRLSHLTRVNEEILGEDRTLELPPREDKVVERAAKEVPIAQHAQRVGNARIAARHSCDVGTGPNRSGRGRSFLDLENEPGARARQRSRETALGPSRASTERIQRDPVEAH